MSSSPATIGRREGEALVAVDDAAEVDAGIRLGEQLGERRLLHDDGEGRRRDEVGVAGGARGLDVEVERVGGEDGARELAHLLPPDEVRAGSAGTAAPAVLGSLAPDDSNDRPSHGRPDDRRPRRPVASGVFVLGASALLAAVALQQVHGVDGNRVAANAVVFVVHDGLP